MYVCMYVCMYAYQYTRLWHIPSAVLKFSQDFLGRIYSSNLPIFFQPCPSIRCVA